MTAVPRLPMMNVRAVFRRGYYIPRSRRNLPLNTVVKFVPQQEAWVVERFGKFSRILEPGLAILVPLVEEIKYVKTLKEVAVEIPSQSAITQDNVTIHIDGVLYYKVIDPFRASYGVEDADFSVTQLAQTTMRSEIGQLTLDKTLAERTLLNHNIVEAINHAAHNWGIECLRYEIRDIQPPETVVKSMHSQVSAERQKRAAILESEGAKQSNINVAEGLKQAAILASEAQKQEQINQASGEAEAILVKARATGAGIREISKAIEEARGENAVTLLVAQKYIEAFANLAKQSNTLMLPSNAGDPANMIGQAMGIYKSITNSQLNPPILPPK